MNSDIDGITQEESASRKKDVCRSSCLKCESDLASVGHFRLHPCSHFICSPCFVNQLVSSYDMSSSRRCQHCKEVFYGHHYFEASNINKARQHKSSLEIHPQFEALRRYQLGNKQGVSVNLAVSILQWSQIDETRKVEKFQATDGTFLISGDGFGEERNNEAYSLLPKIFAIVQPVLMRVSDTLNPVLSVHEFKDMALHDSSLLQHCLYALSTGDCTLPNLSYDTTSFSKARKNWIACYVSKNILLRCAAKIPSSLQVCIGNLLSKHLPMNHCLPRLLSSLFISTSRTNCNKTLIDKVIDSACQGKKRGSKDFLHFAVDNFGMKAKKGYRQWTLIQAVLTTEQRLLKAGFYTIQGRRPQRSRGKLMDIIEIVADYYDSEGQHPSKDYILEKLADRYEGIAIMKMFETIVTNNTAREVVGPKPSDYKSLSRYCLEPLQEVMAMQLPTITQIYHMKETGKIFWPHAELSWSLGIQLDERNNQLEEQIVFAEINIPRLFRSDGDGCSGDETNDESDGIDDSEGNSCTSLESESEFSFDVPFTSLNAPSPSNDGTTTLFTPSSTSSADNTNTTTNETTSLLTPSSTSSSVSSITHAMSESRTWISKYERNGISIDIPYENDLAKVETVRAIMDYSLRATESSDDNVLYSVQDVVGTFIMGDGAPTEIASRIKAEEKYRAKMAGGGDRYEKLYFLPGGFHCLLELYRMKNSLMRDFFGAFVAKWRSSGLSQEWVLNPSDPRDLESELVQYAAAFYRAAADATALCKGRNVSPKEVHEHIIERAAKYPLGKFLKTLSNITKGQLLNTSLVMAYLIDIRFAQVSFMMRDSEKSGGKGDFKLFLSAVRLSLPLFSMTHATKYVRILCEFIEWYEAEASESQKLVFENFVFTKMTSTGRCEFSDRSVENMILDFRRHVGKRYTRGIETKIEMTGARIVEDYDMSEKGAQEICQKNPRKKKLTMEYIQTYAYCVDLNLFGEGDPKSSEVASAVLQVFSFGCKRIEDYYTNFYLKNRVRGCSTRTEAEMGLKKIASTRHQMEDQIEKAAKKSFQHLSLK